MKKMKLTNVDFLLPVECFVNWKACTPGSAAHDCGLRIGNGEGRSVPIPFPDAALEVLSSSLA
jgi:hypothetical protein